ncbi:MAG: hypothetical protein Q9163_000505 [Psora crenata]
MSTSAPSTGQKSDAPYELIYWPSLPGRGEPIRLCFEATSTPYTDVGNSSEDGVQAVLEQISEKNLGDASNPPPLAPPMLRHGDVLLSQLPNILLYLGSRMGLAGPEDDEMAVYRVNQLALTALDGLSNEVHDIHHPIAPGKYYEDQKESAKLKAEDWIASRLPKFLGYFERVLQGEASKGGEYLYAGRLTYADLVLWQCIDGVAFAFPNAFAKVKNGDHTYAKVLALYDRIKDRKEIKEYLASERRMKYGHGLYRHYPELDIDA